MKVIGITGGVGSGKSALLSYVEDTYNCKVILADEVAHRVREPGNPGYESLIGVLSSDVLDEDGTINRVRMAKQIFVSDDLRKKVNDIIHPAVKETILAEIDRGKKEEKLDFLFIEAALLIEDGYLDIVDEMWYIYADEAVRRQRLRAARNYPDDRISLIMKSQLTEEGFREACDVVIDNSKSLDMACRQIDEQLKNSAEMRIK
jgi:dephospho-CoA kinase